MARQKIVFGLLFIVLGAALFVTASAYCVDHSYGQIVAAVLGGFAFPVAPVGWHVIAERRRRAKIAAAKSPPKTSLTGYDRYWLRFVLVALAVLGPMFATSQLGVLGAVGRHGLWFVPSEPADGRAIGSGSARDLKAFDYLLKHVPGDAELVIVAKAEAGGVVGAWGARQGMVATDDNPKDPEPLAARLAKLNKDLEEHPYLPVGKLSLISSDKVDLIASDGWKAQVEAGVAGPSEELRTELARAPQGAQFIAAFAPRTKITAADLDTTMIRHGVAWMVANDKTLAFAGRIEAIDAAAAAKLVGELRLGMLGGLKDVPEKCRAEVEKLVAKLELSADGAIITARLEVPTDVAFGLMFCAK